jgi:signal transduction histidine kinase
MSAAKRPTFRLRLAIHTMIVAGVLVAASGAAAWWYAQRLLARNLDLRVSDSARRLWTQLTPRHGNAEMREAASTVFCTEFLDQGKISVVVQSHTPGFPVIYRSMEGLARGFPDHLPSGHGVITSPEDSAAPERTPSAQRGRLLRPQMPEIRQPSYFTDTRADGQWRYTALSSPRYTVFVGLSTREFYAEARQAAGSFAAAGVAGLMLAGLGAWWHAGRAMRPLQRVVARAENLSVAELGERLPTMEKDDREFAQLIAVLNGMMERLQASFQQAARFTADASHELKTPLAVMQATLNDSLRSGEPPPVEELLAEVSRLKSITQSLLLLSQADAGKLPLQHEVYNLSTELSGIAEDAEALCESAGLTCEHAIAPGIEIVADRLMMRLVFRNLLSNAVKYNRPGGSVTMKLQREETRAVFTLTNTGHVIPLEMQPRLFERFFRVDPARYGEGTGLGLNIASELAKANGAEVTLVESRNGRTTLRVGMPCHMKGS